MKTSLLTREKYLETFSGKNIELETQGYHTDHIWDYTETIPIIDYSGYEIAWGQIPFIYQTGDEHYDHIFVSTKTSNAFVLVIVDNQSQEIIGHHLLDLNIEYEIKN
jgi:hypothetical protein